LGGFRGFLRYILFLRGILWSSDFVYSNVFFVVCLGYFDWGFCGLFAFWFWCLCLIGVFVMIILGGSGFRGLVFFVLRYNGVCWSDFSGFFDFMGW